MSTKKSWACFARPSRRRRVLLLSRHFVSVLFFSYACCACESCGGVASLGGLGMTDGGRGRWSPPGRVGPAAAGGLRLFCRARLLGSTWHCANQDGAGRRFTAWLGPVPPPKWICAFLCEGGWRGREALWPRVPFFGHHLRFFKGTGELSLRSACRLTHLRASVLYTWVTARNLQINRPE